MATVTSKQEREIAGTGERLIDAATALLDKGGQAAVTLRSVAQAVGVSHNTPYRHFADRAALLAGVAERDFGSFTATFESIAKSKRTPIGKVKAALEAFAAYAEAHPARYRLLFSDPDIASQGGDLEARAMETFAAFGRIVEGAQMAGDLPALSTETLAGLVYATVHGLIDFRAGGRLRNEKGFTTVLDGALLLLNLIRPAGAATKESSRRAKKGVEHRLPATEIAQPGIATTEPRRHS